MGAYVQIILWADLFVAGIVCGLAAHYAYTHLGKRADAQREAAQRLPQKEYLPTSVKEQLLRESQARFELAVNNSGTQLERDLETTAGLLDKLVKRLGAEIVSDELERYRIELAELRKKAQADLQGVSAEVNQHRAELETQLAEEIASEKQRLLQQINTKLADAVGTFLVETLQHNIDLGSQEAYLLAMLEEHKADFTKQVDNDGNAS